MHFCVLTGVLLYRSAFEKGFSGINARSLIEICHDATANAYLYVLISAARPVMRRYYARSVLQKAKNVTAISAIIAVIEVHIGILVCLNSPSGRISCLNDMICRGHYWHEPRQRSDFASMISHSIYNYAITIF